MVTYASTLAPQQETSGREQRLSLSAVIWFSVLLLIAYGPILNRLVQQWMQDEDMGHGFFVPVLAGYIAWQKRDELSRAGLRTNYWGLLLVAWGVLQMLIGSLGAELFLSRTSFLISLTGIVLFLGGTPALRILAFPLFLLLFMIPIPAVVYGSLTLPLQLLASRIAENILGLIGIPVLRDGNVLELASQKLSVVEACSGIRSLLSLSFLSLIYAYFFDTKVWMRAALLFATVPIAIAANAARVTITAILSEIRTDLAHGFFHTLEGWMLFVVALVLLIGTHQLINRIYRMKHATA